MAWLLRDGQVLASLDVADTFRDRTRGLLGRSSYDGAMLLAHTKGVHSFGVRFRLDVAWLDRDLVVIGIRSLRRSSVAWPRWRARNVLEAEAGAFERWELRVGDHLEIKK